jgi:subtilase family serine protease
MRPFLFSLLLSAIVVFSGSPLSSAQTIQRSGNTYHKPVCPGPASQGTARCHAHVVTDSKGNPLSKSASANVAPSGFSPASLRSAYNIPWDGSQTTPSGPIIAIVDAYGYSKAESDLAVYRQQFGLPACTSANGCFAKYNQSGTMGSYPNYNIGWAQETALDLDMASAMCPSCRIILIEGNSASYNNLATAENTAASLGAHTISNSYGGGESGATASNAQAYNHPGIAITVSTGDSGYGVEFPASLPLVIATGGTSLVAGGDGSSLRQWSETAWSGTGSGCSAVYAARAWQPASLPNPCGNLTGTLKQARVEADVSAVADPNTGVAVYGPVVSTFSGWLVFGGTSVASPLIAGIYGVNGTTPSKGNYGRHLYNKASNLYDVTSGQNGNCGAPLCQATTGYDGPTGLGTPNGTIAF